MLRTETLTPRARIKRMTETVCAKFNVHERDLMSKFRTAPLPQARHELMTMIREQFGWSHERIGTLWGMDQSTVRNGIEKHRARDAERIRIEAGLGPDWPYATGKLSTRPKLPVANRDNVENVEISADKSGRLSTGKTVVAGTNSLGRDPRRHTPEPAFSAQASSTANR